MFRNYTCLFFILFLTQVISQERDSNNYTYNGNKFSEKKVFDEAEMSYRKAISSEPNNLKALYNLGNTHYKEKDFDEAAQRFFQAQKETDNKFQKHKAFHNMGNVYMQQKEYAKAIEAYKNALRNDSTDDKTRYNYALAKELLEKEKQKQKDKLYRLGLIKEELFPNNSLQEREINFSEFYQNHGDKLMDCLFKNISPFNNKFLVISL